MSPVAVTDPDTEMLPVKLSPALLAGVYPSAPVTSPDVIADAPVTRPLASTVTLR